MQEAARSRYNDVLDFDSSSAILKIEWREEVGPRFYCACLAVFEPCRSPCRSPDKYEAILALVCCGDWGDWVHSYLFIYLFIFILQPNTAGSCHFTRSTQGVVALFCIPNFEGVAL